MDPFTAIGLASSIVTFIDVGIKVVTSVKDIYQSPNSTGLTRENRHLEFVVKKMAQFSDEFKSDNAATISKDEGDLYDLAERCRGLAVRILNLVDGTRSENTDSLFSNIRAVKKSFLCAGERKQLEEELRDCNAQLSQCYSFLNSSRLKSGVDELILRVDGNFSHLQKLSSQIEVLRQEFARFHLSPAAEDQLNSLQKITEHARDLLTKRCIVQSLRFNGIHQRFEDVPTAHEKTFRWIFEDNRGASSFSPNGDFPKDDNPPKISSPDEEFSRQEFKEAFSTWLSSGSGIFHVAGKLGSGKSTLMKFLSEHPSTKARLREWAAPRELVFAHFFFWKPGSTLQKTLVGLMRSLLYDVLQAFPRLVQRIMPGRWEHARQTLTPYGWSGELDLPAREIETAFTQLVSNSGEYEDYRFCFFIDGLDEYEGTDNVDQIHFCQELRSWAQADNVKLCVSSRMENVFMNELRPERCVSLHDLTKEDMRRYISKELEDMEGREGENLLRSAIIGRAEGVFLWVTLVVRNIRTLLRDGYDVQYLRKVIDDLPERMEELFSQLLDSSPPRARKEAGQVFAIIEVLRGLGRTGENYYLSPLAYSFLDDYNDDSCFALESIFNIGQENLETRINKSLKRLNGCCKGLVETTLPKHYRQAGHTYDYAIKFTHRSVAEFLAAKTQKPCMRGLEAVDCLTNLVLAELRACPLLLRRICWTLPGILVRLRYENQLDHPPYSYLNVLCTTFDLRTPTSPLVYCGVLSNDKVAFLGSFLCQKDLRFSTFPPLHPVYQAVFYGHFDYFTWKLANDRESIAKLNLELLLNCVVQSEAEKPTEEVLHVVRTLTKFGLNHLAPATIKPGLRDPKIQQCQETSKACPYHIMVWDRLFLDLNDPCRARPGLGFAVQVFLEQGADPFFRYFTSQSEANKTARGVFIFGKERREISVNPFDLDQPETLTEFSLIEFLGLCNFENKDVINHLIEKNENLLGRTDEGKIINSVRDISHYLAAQNGVATAEPTADGAEESADEKQLEEGTPTEVVAEDEKPSIFTQEEDVSPRMAVDNREGLIYSQLAGKGTQVILLLVAIGVIISRIDMGRFMLSLRP